MVIHFILTIIFSYCSTYRLQENVFVEITVHFHSLIHRAIFTSVCVYKHTDITHKVHEADKVGLTPLMCVPFLL